MPTLEKLWTQFAVPLVVTQPDRPKGRGMEVALCRSSSGHCNWDCKSVSRDKIKNNEEFRGQLAGIAPDAIIVVGYGRIIPQWMIDLPRSGNLNLHASLLPRYRGAAPIQWAIARGESMTGVTTMRIDAGLDTGDILLQIRDSDLAAMTQLSLWRREWPRSARTSDEPLPRLQSAQGFNHEVGADRSHSRRQSYGCVLRRDWDFFLQQNVSGIETGIDPHGGDAGHALAAGNGPLDRRRSAIFGQQRSMQVEISQPRQINHPLRNDAPVSDNDDRVRRDFR